MKHYDEPISSDRARRLALELAVRCHIDPRTARRAIECGVNALRVWNQRLRVEEAAAELGVRLPLAVEPRRRPL